MFKKLLICSAAFMLSSHTFGAWEFRGEPNNWGISPMTAIDSDRHVIRQVFSASQDEFKIAKDGSWAISFPVQNFKVAPGKTYDITFFESTKNIQAIEVTSSSTSSLSLSSASSSNSSSLAAENWVFRGTANNWGKTPMTQVGNVFVTCQNFGSDDPRFKIMNGNKADWVEAYPAQDFRVTANTSFDITFTPATKAIQATPRTTACGTSNTLSSSSSSRSSSSAVNSSSSLSSSSAATENWVFRGTPNNWGLTPMTQSGSTFVTCQDFGADDPRFKISNGNKASWVEAYPAQDFRVAANTSFDIIFTPATKQIQANPRSNACNAPTTIDVERSLFVRDQATLNGADFKLTSVFTQLANQFNAANPAETLNNVQLFARFWDTQNQTPGLLPGGPKCEFLLNGFQNFCRPSEGIQAQAPLDFIGNYIPIALVNRFDLRDKVNFQNCGEYRVVYSLPNVPGRNFIIFEAQLPNPTPGAASGCAPIANFWKNLSAESNATTRATALRNFYFNGIPAQNVRAVIDIRNYAEGAGQIRTNQFMSFQPWVLREFKTAIEGGLSIIKPVTTKDNPVGFLFNDARLDSLSVEFRQQFLANMGTLVKPNINEFSLFVQNDAHNNGQSHASGFATMDNDFQNHSVQGTGDFRNAIQARAAALGSNLTTDQVLRRATAMTCGGCHNPNAFGLTSSNSIGTGQTWPQTLGFTHVEEFTTNGKFNISPALQNVFLPARKIDFESFINSQNSGATAAPAAAPSNLTVNSKRSG